MNGRYPLIKVGKNSKILLEPLGQIIFSSYTKDISNKIVNEDSQDPEISAGNLFSINRFRGFDRIEDGHRINYGIRGNISSTQIDNLFFLIGQSYRMKKDNNFDMKSGMDGKSSDYVVKLSLHPTHCTYLINNARFNKNTFNFERNEITMGGSHNDITADIKYVSESKNISEIKDIYRQELFSSIGYDIHKEWHLHGMMRRKFGKRIHQSHEPMLKTGFGLDYKGSCLNISMSVSRDYTKLKDIIPSTDYSFSFGIPTF